MNWSAGVSPALRRVRPLGGPRVSGAAFDPASDQNDQNLWAVADTGAFRSQNGGTSWTAMAALPGIEADGIASDPQSGDLWVATATSGWSLTLP